MRIRDEKSRTRVPGETILYFRVAECGSGSGLDPDLIGSVDPNPDPYFESGSGSRRAKMTHKSGNFLKSSCFEVLDGLF
jgi:hypothetical protein